MLGFDEAAFFSRIYDVSDRGNFEGASILNRLGHTNTLPPEEEARLAHARAQLLARRDTRIRPATDDKILADWNGLVIAALALAGQTFRQPAWIAAADTAFQFILGTMSRDGRLAHAWRHGKAVYPAVATDYAAMIKGALALHAATLAPAYLAKAERLAAVLLAHYWNAETPGYYLSADDAEALILRPRSTTDEATPSATSVMTANAVRLWRLTGDVSHRDRADAAIAASPIAENLFAATAMLSALDLRLGAVDVVIVAPAGSDPEPLLAALRRHWSPSIVLSVHEGAADLPDGHPAAQKTPVGGEPTAYVCRGNSCSLPVTTAEALITQLAPTGTK